LSVDFAIFLLIKLSNRFTAKKKEAPAVPPALSPPTRDQGPMTAGCLELMLNPI